MNFPTDKIELHQWINSGLLLIVAFFAQQTYEVIVADHNVIAIHATTLATHELRLNNLEQEDKKEKQTSMAVLEAILPNNDFKIKKQNENN